MSGFLQNRFRLSLREMLLATAIVALMAGFFAQRAIHRREIAAEKKARQEFLQENYWISKSWAESLENHKEEFLTSKIDGRPIGEVVVIQLPERELFHAPHAFDEWACRIVITTQGNYQEHFAAAVRFALEECWPHDGASIAEQKMPELLAVYYEAKRAGKFQKDWAWRGLEAKFETKADTRALLVRFSRTPPNRE